MKHSLKHELHDEKSDQWAILMAQTTDKLKQILRSLNIGIPKTKKEMAMRIVDGAKITSRTVLTMTIKGRA